VKVADNYAFDPVAGGTGPLLKYNGAAFVMGQPGFGTWAPIAVEAVGGGYDVAWKDASGQYTVWATDSNGNFVSTLLGAVTGTNATLQSLESTFQQDLNGDGTIGVHASVALSAGASDSFQFHVEPVASATTQIAMESDLAGASWLKDLIPPAQQHLADLAVTRLDPISFPEHVDAGHLDASGHFIIR
jgi:hypothetical protein